MNTLFVLIWGKRMTNKIGYYTTKKECEEQIKGKVCDGCGGKLKAMEMKVYFDDIVYHAWCIKEKKHCWQVDKIVWKIARKLAKSGEIIANPKSDKT